MASGQTLCRLLPTNNEPPASGAAIPDVRNARPVLVYADGATENGLFSDILPLSYDGGGLTVYLHASYGPTSGSVVWNVAFERTDAGTLDIDGDSFATAQAATQAVPGTTGVTAVTAIPFTDGAQMDSVAAGELFRLKVTRLGTDGSDNAAGVAQLLAVHIKET